MEVCFFKTWVIIHTLFNNITNFIDYQGFIRHILNYTEYNQ